MVHALPSQPPGRSFTPYPPRLVFQHREGVQDPLPGAHHPRHGGRGDRLLPRPGAVRALPQGGGAPLGGGRRPQRHRALQPVPGAATALHQPRPGRAARLKQCVCVPVCVCVWVKERGCWDLQKCNIYGCWCTEHTS